MGDRLDELALAADGGEPWFHTFEMPESGTIHILRADPAQKTIAWPQDNVFPAVAYCGHLTYLLPGDLTAHTEPVAVDALSKQLCRACQANTPDLYTTAPTETE